VVIDYEKYPVLNAIQKRKPDFGVRAEDMSLLQDMEMGVGWANHSKMFKNIKFISKAFLISLDQCLVKLTECDEVFHGEYSDSVVFIRKRENKKTETYCADFVFKDGETDKMIMYYFQDDALIMFTDTTSNKHYVHPGAKYIDGVSFMPDSECLRYQVQEVFFLFLFTKFAKLETKTVFPKRKQVFNGEKYLNNTDFVITQLDSKWFTNLVKSEGFNVRGHFRLQPYKKDGQWTRELIWIDEFQKTGYTAPARKLAAGETKEII
jgi:hypothetical protein